MNIIKDPIYQQLNKILRGLISSGKFKPGEQFLTERKICEQFEVSRATANKALSNLVSEGILEFKKGVGTFVANKFIDFDLRSLISFTNITRDSGKSPSTKILDFEIMKAKEAEEYTVSELSAEPDDTLYYMERVRLIDNMPFILERRYIAEKHCKGIKKNMIEDSLYSLWVDQYKLKIIGAVQIIKSIIINKQDSKLLNIDKPEAGFLVSGIGYLEGNVPLWSERTLFRGSKYEFRNTLGSTNTSSPGTRLFLNS